MFKRSIGVLGRCCASAALFLAGAAVAAPSSSSGSGTFGAFPGFGYEYVATWEGSAGSYSFDFLATSEPGDNGSIRVLAGFVGAPSAIYSPSFDFSARVELRFIDLATGALGLPAQFDGRFNRAGAEADYRVLDQATELRFSNPLQTTQVALVDPATGLGIGSGRPVPATAMVFTVEQRFVGGHFLTPSADPNCASFDCMTPGRDRLQVLNPGSFLAEVAMVPTPGSWGLMLAGLAATVLVARRNGAGRPGTVPPFRTA